MNRKVDTDTILPGFARPATDSQRTFRAILDAMSRPGRIYVACGALAPQAALHPATAAAALTLLDFETPLWTDLPEDAPERAWLQFHCGAPLTEREEDADFALITRPEAMPPLERFKMGTEREPHRSATVILQIPGLAERGGKAFSGPGIEAVHHLDPRGVPDHFWESRKRNLSLFPLGVDVLFTSNDKIAAMPRTTEWKPCM